MIALYHISLLEPTMVCCFSLQKIADLVFHNSSFIARLFFLNSEIYHPLQYLIDPGQDKQLNLN